MVASPNSMSRAQVQGAVRAPSLLTTTLQTRSADSKLTRTVWLMDFCGPRKPVGNFCHEVTRCAFRSYRSAGLRSPPLMLCLVATRGELYVQPKSVLDSRNDQSGGAVPGHVFVSTSSGRAKQQRQLHLPTGFRIPLRSG